LGLELDGEECQLMFTPQSDMNSGMAITPMQMSGATLPNPQPSAPGQPGAGPQVVAPPELPRNRSYGWVWLVALVVAAGVGYWTWQQRQEQAERQELGLRLQSVARQEERTNHLLHPLPAIRRDGSGQQIGG
jgi:uncharacterized protein HemX